MGPLRTVPLKEPGPWPFPILDADSRSKKRVRPARCENVWGFVLHLDGQAFLRGHPGAEPSRLAPFAARKVFIYVDRVRAPTTPASPAPAFVVGAATEFRGGVPGRVQFDCTCSKIFANTSLAFGGFFGLRSLSVG